MKTELKAKFLQNILRKKQENEGFTLIELLVVIIIIGILSAIALPSFLNQANKARQSEAKNAVGSMNRAQQAFYLENNSEFTSQVSNLALGIKTSTENYLYVINTPDLSVQVTNKGKAKATALKSYAGVTYTSTQQVDGINESITLASMCEGNKPITAKITTGENIPNGTNNGDCPANMKVIK